MGPQNTTERPVWLGPKMNENEKAPVDPVGQDVNLTEQDEPVDRSGRDGPTKYDRAVGLARADEGRDEKSCRVPRGP